jgi:hypothetical protein
MWCKLRLGTDQGDGNLTVNLDPLPNSLSTVSSPPINSQNLRESAKPKPVPPYFLAVLASACVKAWKSFPNCSGVIPIPVSLITNCSADILVCG